MTTERALKWLLRFIGFTTIPALVAAVMPQSWFEHLIHRVDPAIPVGLLVTYLGRLLMALYAFTGLLCFIMATDVHRYRPLIWVLGVGSLIAASIGFVALVSAVPLADRSGFYWVVFVDFAEGFAQALLLVILLVRIPKANPRP